METSWPEPVERVSSYLRESGAEARIHEFSEGTPTAEDAAAAVGCGVEKIVKSLVLVCDGEPVVALVPGDRRGDTRKIGEAVGASSVRIAKAQEVEDATGFAPGAVAPFPLPKIRDVLMERELFRHHLVWAGAGSPRHIVGIAPGELARVAQARALDVVTEETYDSTGPKES